MKRNKARRMKAKWALQYMGYWTDKCIGSDFEDGIVDLIADLLHLAYHRGMDLEGIIRKAQMHQGAEK